MRAQLAQFDRRNLKIILVLLFVLIAAGLHTYLFWPQFKEFRKLNRSHQLLQSAVTNSNNLQQDLDNRVTQIQELKKSLHGDMANLPQKQFESYIVGQLQRIAWKNSVELTGIKPKKGELVDQFREIIFDIDMRGDYYHIFDLLTDVADALGFVVVKRCTMRPDSVIKDEQPLMVTVTIASYRMET
jgi:Tfp pilus assembly protein PilO